MNTIRSCIPPQSHRIMTSVKRAHTEPAPSVGGFMRSMMRHRGIDDMDDRIGILSQRERKFTQEEQDALDKKQRKRAMRNLVNSWQERLQLISVITTFFASTGAAMLVNTKPVNPEDWGSGALKAANASLLGALIVHANAAILSFLGAFLLTGYKVEEDTREEMIAEGINPVDSPFAGSVSRDVGQDPAIDLDLELQVQRSLTNNDAQSMMHESVNVNTEKSTSRPISRGSFPAEPPTISRNHRLGHGGILMGDVSSHILSRTHAVCVFLTAVGFILAIVGILCYAWASQPTEVSIFASVCLGGVLLAMVPSLLIGKN